MSSAREDQNGLRDPFGDRRKRVGDRLGALILLCARRAVFVT
jgi:hypothetical protein